MALPIRTPRYPDGAKTSPAAAILVAAAACGRPAGGGPAEPARDVGEPVSADLAPAAAGPAAAPPRRVGRSRSRIRPTGRFDVGAGGGATNTYTLLDTAGKGAVPVS